MAGGCGESKGKKSKPSCPESKRETSKSSCPDSKKEKSKSSCSDSKGSKNKKDAFGRPICKEEEKEPECHETRKRFFEKDSKDKKCKPKEKKKEKPDCKDAVKKKEAYTCKSASGNDCCSGGSKGCQSPCAKIVGSSKRTKSCTDFGKQYVQSDPKPKPKKDEGPHLKLPEPQVLVVRPCLPRVEKSIAVKKKRQLPACLVQEKKTCPQLTKALMAEFFCIDARNRKMNECIKHYMTTDPSQVLVQCSQFARRGRPLAARPPPGPGLLPPKYWQIARRWLPAAGVYAVVTAAVAAWVTEWGPVVDRIPGYRDKPAPPKTPAAAPPGDLPAESHHHEHEHEHHEHHEHHHKAQMVDDSTQTPEGLPPPYQEPQTEPPSEPPAELPSAPAVGS